MVMSDYEKNLKPQGEDGGTEIPQEPAPSFYHYSSENSDLNAAPAEPQVGSRTSGVPYGAQMQYTQNGYGYAQQQGMPRNDQNWNSGNAYYGNGGAGNVPPGNMGYDAAANAGGAEPPKKKKSKTPLIVAVVAVVCLGLGGAIGGLVAGRSNDGKENSTLSSPAPEEVLAENNGSAADSAEEADKTAAFHPTTIDIQTNSTDNKLTPQDVYENYVNAVVAISNSGTVTNVFGQTVPMASSGSGFVISSDGYILTNNHVIEDAQTLTVMLTSGEEYDATVIGADPENDVALIKIDATDLPTASIGDSDSISVGEQVCAIGNPLGELTNTLTVGYISALDREIAEPSSTVINMFQTDCAINSGNSGGPLFDMHGNVVGITTAKPSSSSSSATVEGIGFCIPINDAMNIVNDILQYGYVTGRASLGITCRTISSAVTQYYNLPVGVYVDGCNAGSAAEKAGLQQGDIITAIDDTETASVSDLKLALKNYTAGDQATLTIFRNNESITVDVVLDEATTSVETPEATTETPSQQQIPFSNGFGFSFGY